MWILSFIPDAIFHYILVTGALLVLASIFLGFIPLIRQYKIPVRYVGAALLAIGIFFEGAIYNNNAWVARVKEMEAKVALAEQQSVKENVRIVEKIVKQTEYIKTRGEDIVKYVDREVVKYDTKFAPGGQCEIPKEFIKAINDAAEAPK